MTFEPTIEREHLSGLEGIQKLYRFPNGYGASVVKFIGSYGYKSGLWELGVIKYEGDKFNLVYDTSVTDDVIGWLNDDKVETILQIISELPND